MNKFRQRIACAMTAVALAGPLGAAHAQLSPPEPGSKPPADRDLSGGKKMPSTGLVEKKNANAAKTSPSSASATPHGGSASMPGGVSNRSKLLPGDKDTAR